MTKADYLALAEARYEALHALQQHPDFYSYEKSFDQIWTELGGQVLARSIGAVPGDKRKKTKYGPATGPSK